MTEACQTTDTTGSARSIWRSLTTNVTAERSRAQTMATSLAQRLGTVPLTRTTDAWTDTLTLLKASSESRRSI